MAELGIDIPSRYLAKERVSKNHNAMYWNESCEPNSIS